MHDHVTTANPCFAPPGIIISISIITALGVAVLENPQVQRWLEQQRRNLVELLSSIGSELDPQSRREAEAFAFEGRTVTNDPAIRREMEASRDAAAVATGRSAGSPSAVRRIPVRGPGDESAAEERRRQGREYLAKRNQQMYELHQRRKAKAVEDGVEPPPTPTSFDDMVDSEGKLRTPEKELPSPPKAEIVEEMTEKGKERSLERPMMEGEASDTSAGSRGWAWGAALANPFGDEFEMERSVTPKPPVPPKVALDQQPQAAQRESPTNHDELSYEEQLAIALSLSEAESSKPSATVRQTSTDEPDTDLRAAIEASLRDLDDQQAAHMIANDEPTTPRLSAASSQPLVDLTPDPPISAPPTSHPTRWESLFDQPNWADEQRPADPPVSVPAHVEEEDNDELYRITPQLTRARLATLDAAQSNTSLPYDPVHEAAQQPVEASFYSAQSRSTSPPTTTTLPQAEPELIDVFEEPVSASAARTPTSRSSSAFHSDLESESDSFASISHAPSAPRSEISQPQPATPHSEPSEIEVVDVPDGEDSDVDLLSDTEGDGVATPDSWTEVGSRDGESEGERERA